MLKKVFTNSSFKYPRILFVFTGLIDERSMNLHYLLISIPRYMIPHISSWIFLKGFLCYKYSNCNPGGMTVTRTRICTL